MEIDAGQLADLLSREYGIAPTAIVDAPRGFVAETFDVRALNGRRYFVKVLPLWADAAAALDSLPVLEALHTLGIETISRPVRTRAGDLSTTLDELPTLVSEFVETSPTRGVALCYTAECSLTTREREMAAAFMSTHIGAFAYAVKDMTLRANAQPGHPGACRRR